MTGWEPDFLQDVIGNCTNPSGEVSDCHLLTLQSEAEQNKCKINPPGALAKENVFGAAIDKVLNALPGNVPIQAGPESATPYSDGGAAGFFTSLFGGGKPNKTPSSSFSAPTLTYQPGTSSSYPGGGVFLEATSTPAAAAPVPAAPSSSKAPAPAPAPVEPTFKEALAAPSPDTTTPVPSPATTPAPAVSSDPNVSYEAVSTQTITNGAQVQEVVWEEAVKYVTEDVVTTTTVYSGIAGRSEHHRSHLRRHGHGGHRA